MIPRSETEELVYLVLETIPTKELQKGIDIGTGSGCIPVTLKHKRSEWEIHGADVSPEALMVAQQSATENKTYIDFHCFDVLDKSSWPAFSSFDFIVSNPPYIPPSEKVLMPDSVLEHEPGLALFVSEDDPLVFYRTIMEFAEKFLKPGGYLFFEGNEFNAIQVVEMMKDNIFVDVLLERDMQGKDRMVVGRRNE
ncbi:MAG: release factor glutamine methyltransferase [Gammaproteobacteria bacterium]